MRRNAARLLVALGVLAIGSVSLAQSGAYQVGSRVQSFALKDDKGKTHKLSSYRGKHVVLAFYASW